MAMPVHHPWLQVGQIGDVTVVRFTHPQLVDGSEVEAVGEQLLRLPEAGCAKVVVNLAAVSRMTSTVVAKLVALEQKVRAAHGRLVLCGLQPPIAEVFKILRMLPRFTICQGERQALESFLAP
jgi:anti-sigma B factor antagonist